MDVATLGIRVDAEGAAREVENFGQKLDTLAHKGESLKKTMLGVVASAALAGLGHKVLHETILAQDALTQLESAVRSSGGAAGFTAVQLDDMSLELQKLTSFSDEAVKGAQTMLLMFRNIKGDQFEQATKAALDLAAKMGGDAAGAAFQLGRALEDPEHGLMMLRRQGIALTDSQVTLVKQLFETGHIAEAQAIILDVLGKKAGGTAEAMRANLGGALKALGNAIGDVFELTRMQTSGLVSLIDAATAGTRRLKDFTTEIQALALAVGLTGLGASLLAASAGLKEFMFITGITGAFKAAALAGTGLTGVLWGLVPALNAVKASIIGLFASPLGIALLAITALTLGINKYLHVQNDAIDAQERAGEAQDKENQKLIAANNAKRAAAKQAIDDAETARLTTQRVTRERQGELDKVTALNNAYGQSTLERQKLEIEYDAIIQKAKDAKEHHGAEAVALDKVTDALTRQKIVAAELEEGRKNSDEITGMNARVLNLRQEIELIGIEGETAEHLRVEHKATNDLIAARLKFFSDPEMLTIATAQIELERKLGHEVVSTTAAKATQHEVERQQEEITQEIFFRGMNAQRAVIEQMQQVWNNMWENVQRGIGETFTELVETGRVAASTLSSIFKSIFSRMIGELASALVSGQLRAAITGFLNKDPSPSGGGGMLSGLGAQMAGQAGMGALAGGLVGYGLGNATGNRTIGAVGGAVGGAAAGAMVGGPIGAIVGGVVGLAAGLFGAAQKVRELQKQYLENEKSFIDGLREHGTEFEERFRSMAKSFEELRKQASAAGTNVSQKAMAAYQAAQARLGRDFSDSLTRAINDVSGAGGRFANQLSDIEKQYQDNIRTAHLLGADMSTLDKVTELYQKQIEALNRAMEEANRRVEEDSNIRLLNTAGFRDAAALAEMDARHRQELVDKATEGLNAAQLATVQYTQALERESLVKQQIEARLRRSEDLEVRYLEALGQTQEAAARQLDFQQRRELVDLSNAGASEAELGAVRIIQGIERERIEVTRALNHLTQLQQDAVQAAESQVNELRRIHDSLTTFRLGLVTSNLSPLSPEAQLQAARDQLTHAFERASSGDKTGAEQFPELARQFLEMSRQFNASGGTYAQDFQHVVDMSSTLEDMYADQLSTAEQQLSTAQDQLQTLKDIADTLNGVEAATSVTPAVVSALQDEVDAIGGVSDEVMDLIAAVQTAQNPAQFDDLIAAIEAGRDDANAHFDEQIAALRAQREAYIAQTQAQIDQAGHMRDEQRAQLDEQIAILEQQVANGDISASDMLDTLLAQRTSLDQQWAGTIAQMQQVRDANLARIDAQILEVRHQRTDFNNAMDRQIAVLERLAAATSEPVVSAIVALQNAMFPPGEPLLPPAGGGPVGLAGRALPGVGLSGFSVEGVAASASEASNQVLAELRSHTALLQGVLQTVAAAGLRVESAVKDQTTELSAPAFTAKVLQS